MSDAVQLLIGYARVSMEDQNLALQMDALAHAGVRPEYIFSDKASGAAGSRRPGLLAAMKELRAGDTLVVWKLDRLGRNLEELIRTVRVIGEKRANFRCLTQPIDTSTPWGVLIFQIFGAMAEFERALIVERTKAGQAAARARGRHPGRRTVMTPAMRRRITTLLEEGASPVEVARRLKLGKSTVYKYLPELEPPPAVDGLDEVDEASR